LNFIFSSHCLIIEVVKVLLQLIENFFQSIGFYCYHHNLLINEQWFWQNGLVDKIPTIELETIIICQPCLFGENLYYKSSKFLSNSFSWGFINAQFSLIMFAWYHDGEYITLFQFQIPWNVSCNLPWEDKTFIFKIYMLHFMEEKTSCIIHTTHKKNLIYIQDNFCYWTNVLNRTK
jgi:hypothetical protein